MKKIVFCVFALIMCIAAMACSKGISSSTKAGDTVKFADKSWIVLTVDSGKALLLSEKILEERAYNEENAVVTWEDCTLRDYLNNTFYNAFSSDDKSRIVESSLANNDNEMYGTSGGNDTVDKVFLLSLDEVDDYMGSNAPKNLQKAIAAKSVIKNGASSWWLRSPGPGVYGEDPLDNNTASYVDGEGRINVLAYYVHNGNVGVRPAIWVTL
ncbi:MAG: DUF6273 domain-containing protein [Oscillospiraceae bacterium]|nr:DUF6273 domain-containing protein [Oscillospiraceae bacterium]